MTAAVIRSFMSAVVDRQYIGPPSVFLKIRGKPRSPMDSASDAAGRKVKGNKQHFVQFVHKSITMFEMVSESLSVRH